MVSRKGVRLPWSEKQDFKKAGGGRVGWAWGRGTHGTPPPKLLCFRFLFQFPTKVFTQGKGQGWLRVGASSELSPHWQSLVESRLGTTFAEMGSAFKFPGATVMGLGYSPPKGSRADSSGIEKNNYPSSFVNVRVFVWKSHKRTNSEPHGYTLDT